ncbi:MAG: dUTP diphosphatase [Candidatus Shapirobacteria bacterium]
MQIKIKRLDKSLPLPAYKTAGAAAFDLCSRIDIIVPLHQVVLIPLNVAIEVPKGYHSILMSRSSTQKLGISPANGLGLIDNDYCGDNDEWHFAAINHTDHEVKIEKGMRIAQVLIEKTEIIEIVEVEHLDNIDRGGFGTTGVK